MKTKKVLVVEDDTSIRMGIVDALEFEGYNTIEAKDGKIGLEIALTADCDLILLDLVLPFKDGMEILEEVRSARPTLPVIILTARGDEDDRVKGLNLGADDYVVKPFSVKELLARVEAVLRRSPERPSDISLIEIPGGTADFNRCEIRFDDNARVELSERERDLLRYLAQNSDRAVSRKEILSHVWRIDPDRVETRTVDMHIARVREKVRDNGSEPEIILTVRGKGYMFKNIKDG
ncbi:response regulator transcription factor [Planctomycetota bacterium]